jgi:hypothetical protein
MIKTPIAMAQRIIYPLNGISSGLKTSQPRSADSPQKLMAIAP